MTPDCPDQGTGAFLPAGCDTSTPARSLAGGFPRFEAQMLVLKFVWKRLQLCCSILGSRFALLEASGVDLRIGALSPLQPRCLHENMSSPLAATRIKVSPSFHAIASVGQEDEVTDDTSWQDAPGPLMAVLTRGRSF